MRELSIETSWPSLRMIPLLRRDHGHNTDPASDPTPEALQIVFLVRAMDRVVIETEPDEDAVHPEDRLEVPDDRDRPARAHQDRRAAELGFQRFGRFGDEGVRLVGLEGRIAAGPR